MLPNREQLAQLVRQVAREEILPRFAQVGFHLKADGSLLTEADLAANQRLGKVLRQRWPHIAFLSEEMELAQQEALLREADWLWCLDPLDGTSNFAAGVPLFAASLALLRRGQVVLGITYDPIRDELFTAQQGQGAWLNDQALHCHASGFTLKNAVALIDFKRLQPALRQALLREMPFGSQRNLGTCALELAWMAANRGQVYLHGGMKLWDLAVGWLLIKEAGGCITNLQGDTAWSLSVSSHAIVASPDQQLFQTWLDFIKAHCE